jgi:hypothetical protein
MVNNRLTLLLDDDMEAVAAAATRLRQLLPQIHVDRFVEAFPLVLDVDDFELALEVGVRFEYYSTAVPLTLRKAWCWM